MRKPRNICDPDGTVWMGVIDTEEARVDGGYVTPNEAAEMVEFLNNFIAWSKEKTAKRSK